MNYVLSYSVYEIFQARLTRVNYISFSGGFYQPGDQAYISCAGGEFFRETQGRKRNIKSEDMPWGALNSKSLLNY